MLSIYGYPTAGSIVSVPMYFVLRHKGLVSDRWYAGKPMVISNSAQKGVTEEPWDAFTNDSPWKDEGYPGTSPPWMVLRHARSPLSRPYNIVTWNCEHFVSYCHGLVPTSPQVAAVALCAIIGAVAATGVRARVA